MLKRIFAVFFLLFLFFSCKTGNGRLDVDLSGIPAEKVVIHRYDLDLFRFNGNDLRTHLESLRRAYPFFLDTNLDDPAKLADMQDYLDNQRNREFYQAVAKSWQNVGDLENQLTEALRHIRYYFPSFRQPRVYTYISGGDYDHPVQYIDSVLLIGLDNYLGPAFRFYQVDGLPKYRIARTIPEEVLPACVDAIMDVLDPPGLPGNNLLEQIVAAGKRVYLLDAIIPDLEGRFKIRYSEQQYNWIQRNEKEVWAAMIAHQMLYATDGNLMRTFFSDGPFTADFSKESPPRLGEWFGWRIVRDYMEKNPEVTLPQLLSEKDAQKILSESGFKPGL
jgi:hypothetical protein